MDDLPKSHRRTLSGNLKVTVAWFVISGVILGIAIWQAKLAVQRETDAHRPLPPPVKTRFAIRTVSAGSGDPAVDYATRCEKGLTDREIGWILDDFSQSGLEIANFSDRTTDDEIFAYRAAQQRWYHAALVDGLRLTPEQSAHAASHMSELFRKLKADFEEDQAKRDPNEIQFSSVARFDVLLSASWLFLAYDESSPADFRILPWDLCVLTPQQQEITWKDEFSAGLESAAPAKTPTHRDFLNTHPFENSDHIPEQWLLVDAILPVLKPQTFSTDDDEESGKFLLTNARHLHPAQFKLLLLIYPHFAGEIRNALTEVNR